jgi:hypothetical protein
MRLRNYPTKRKLLKDIENLRAENRHLSIELRNARTDLALTSKPMNHQNLKQSALNVWGSQMPKKEKSAEALQSLNG